MQRFVYVMAKNEHGPDVNEDPPKPEGIGKAEQLQDAASGF